MCIFNIGLTYGLSKLGGVAGILVPSAFMDIPGVEDSPIYAYRGGLIIALVLHGYSALVRPLPNLPSTRSVSRLKS